MKNNIAERQFGRNEYDIVYKTASIMAYRIFHVKNQYDVDDLIQEAMVKILTVFQSYDSSKSKFSTWASKTIHNYFVDLAVKEFNRTLHPVSLWKESYNDSSREYEVVPVKDYPHDSTPEDDFSIQEFQKNIFQITSQLSEQDRMYLDLSIQGFKNKEIAGICGNSAGNVAVNLHRTRKALSKDTQLQRIMREYELCA